MSFYELIVAIVDSMADFIDIITGTEAGGPPKRGRPRHRRTRCMSMGAKLQGDPTMSLYELIVAIVDSMADFIDIITGTGSPSMIVVITEIDRIVTTGPVNHDTGGANPCRSMNLSSQSSIRWLISSTSSPEAGARP